MELGGRQQRAETLYLEPLSAGAVEELIAGMTGESALASKNRIMDV